jgi:DNA polymerase III delta prime subunit
MALDIFIKDNFLHHAYCIVGNAEKIVFDLQNFLEKEFNFPIVGNPDFWYGEYDVLDIEDSRKLKDLHQNKPTVFDKKVFVVNTNFITEKAQNSMLKFFEEPSGDTHFFLIMPSAQNIIPTLKSRMIILEHEEINNSLTNGKRFLKSSISERMEMIKELMGSISDEEKSKIEVVKLINSIELELKNKTDFLKSDKKYLKVFEEIEKIRQYASDASPSLKMLLEYLALIV